MSFKEHKFLILFVILGISFFIFLVTYEINNHDDTIKKVDCYDRYSNKIDGLECEQEPIPIEGLIFLNFVLSFMLIFTGVLLDFAFSIGKSW